MPAKKALYLNPLKNDAYKILDKDFVTKHPLVKEGYYYDDRHYAPGKLGLLPCGIILYPRTKRDACCRESALGKR